MFSIASWNIRGLNRIPKQKEVLEVVREKELSMCAILESHVDISKLQKECTRVFDRWKWSSNNQLCNRGTRIIVGWDPNVVDIMVLTQTDQVIHCQVQIISDKKMMLCSFIYAGNNIAHRRELWQNLVTLNIFVNNNPWVLLGDFNVALNLDDSTMGSSGFFNAMVEFRECIENIGIEDINSSGIHFTWNQRPNAELGILKKLDRIMVNGAFLSSFVDCFAVFKPYRISDHSPAILKIPQLTQTRPKRFKFANFLVHKPECIPMVRDVWKLNVDGYNMYQVVKKLKKVKTEACKLMWKNGNLHARAKRLRGELDDIQYALDKNPDNKELRLKESSILKAFNDACLDEELFLQQKAKIKWLKEGDGNTGYFHKQK